VSWAIQHKADEIDRKFWQREGVDIAIVDLDRWVDAMRAQV